MCAITGSFNKEKLKELYKLNAYRGEMSYSLATFTPSPLGGDLVSEMRLGVLMQNDGSMPEELVDTVPLSENGYLIAHSQAPTTDTKNIHPAVYGSTMLWHNGIIKQKTIPEETWDTQWLLEQIVYYGWSSLSRIDGTFACIMYNNNEIYVFRNEISPLFYDDELNFSSTKFEGSKSLEPNKVFRVNFNYKQLSPVAFFETFENPYYIPEV